MVAQRTMTATEYITWTDYLAQAIEVLLTAKGVEDSAATAAAYAAAMRNAITALPDPDEADITVDLLPSAIALVAKIELESQVSSLFAGFNSAITSHLGSDVNTLLSAAGLRVHHYWKRAGNTALLAANCFPPVTILGTFAVTGAGAGTFTDGSSVDTAKYGGAQIELEVINQEIGAANVDVTVTVTLSDGSSDTRAGQIPSGSIVGATVQLGASSDRIIGITNVTVLLGTNGDDFQVQTVEDRTL